MHTELRPDVHRAVPLQPWRVEVSPVPRNDWFDFLATLEGRSFAWGMVGGRPFTAGRIEVADWAPFDGIVELVVRQDDSLRRRRLLIDLPCLIDTSVLSTGRTRVRIRGARARAALVVSTDRSGPGATRSQAPRTGHRRTKPPVSHRSAS